MTISKSTGRPRIASITPSVLAAARDLVARHGFHDVTMKMISDAAAVSRQAVYRRWPTKADLLMDAFGARAEAIPVPSDAPAQDRMTRYLEELFASLEGDATIIRHLIAAAQDDADFRNRFRDRFVARRDEVLGEIVVRGIRRGELEPDTDPHLVAELIHGAFWYRLLTARPLTPEFARELSAQTLGRGQPQAAKNEIAPTTTEPELQYDFTYSLLPARQAWLQAADAALAGSGLTAALATPVLLLSKLGDGVNQQALAHAIGIQPAALTRTISLCEEGGLIERREADGDRRAKALFLLPRGAELARSMEAVLARLRIEVVGGWSGKDIALATAVLRDLESRSRAWTERAASST